jgi:choline dehydrogenase-like flavoprotein
VGEAAGVELASGEVVAADRVYVCAGPEASTRLLLHSGVGDRAASQWESCGVPCVVHNAAVGQGYHDHPTGACATLRS